MSKKSASRGDTEGSGPAAVGATGNVTPALPVVNPMVSSIPSSSSSSGALESSDSTALVSSTPEGGVFVVPRSKRSAAEQNSSERESKKAKKVEEKVAKTAAKAAKAKEEKDKKAASKASKQILEGGSRKCCGRPSAAGRSSGDADWRNCGGHRYVCPLIFCCFLLFIFSFLPLFLFF